MSVQKTQASHARKHLKIGVLTASDTRTPENDKSGALIKQMFEAAGHRVEFYEIVRDDAETIAAAIIGSTTSRNLDAMVITGGTESRRAHPHRRCASRRCSPPPSCLVSASCSACSRVSGNRIGRARQPRDCRNVQRKVRRGAATAGSTGGCSPRQRKN